MLLLNIFYCYEMDSKQTKILMSDCDNQNKSRILGKNHLLALGLRNLWKMHT